MASLWQDTAFDLPRRVTMPGRDTCTGSCETRAGCDCCRPAPAECATGVGEDYSGEADRDAEAAAFKRKHDRISAGLFYLTLTVVAAAVLARYY